MSYKDISGYTNNKMHCNFAVFPSSLSFLVIVQFLITTITTIALLLLVHNGIISSTTSTSSSSSFLVAAFVHQHPQQRYITPQILQTITLSRTQTVPYFFNKYNHFDSVSSSSSTSSSSLTMSIVDSSNSITDLWDMYNQALLIHPIITKSITASIILGCGDFAGQYVQQLQSDPSNNVLPSSSTTATTTTQETTTSFAIDYYRTIRFAIFGLVLQAPWNHYYYLLLDGTIPPTVDEPFSTTNIIKVGIDQFIQAPIFTIFIFIFLGLLEGKTISTIQQQIQNDYPTTIIANWKLWIPATIINIGFVPPILRVLYLNIVFFFWSIYLSLILNKKEE